MSENLSSQLELTSKDSISFPYTRGTTFSASKNGSVSARIRFKPVRSDVLMQELLKEENSQKDEDNTIKVSTPALPRDAKCETYDSLCNDNDTYAIKVSSCALSRNTKCETYDCICNEDETSINILDTTILEDDSAISNIVADFALLDFTPNQKPDKLTNKMVLDTPSNVFSKLHLNDNICTKKEPINQGLSVNLFKTPSYHNNKMFTSLSTSSQQSSSVQKNHCSSSTSNKDSIFPSTYSQLLLTKKKILENHTPKRNLQLQIYSNNKAHDTPKQNILATVKKAYTPRTKLPHQSVNTFDEKQHTVKKADTILQEKNMNLVITNGPLKKVKTELFATPDTQKKDKITNLKTNRNKIELEPPKHEHKHSDIVTIEPLNNNLNVFMPESKTNDVISRVNDHQKQVLSENQINNEKKQLHLNNEQVTLFSSNVISELKAIKVRGKNYIMLNKLGEGGSGQVYMCFEQDTLQCRAIKIVNLDVDDHTATSYKNEVKLLMNMQGSDRVIRMYDYEESKQRLFVIMEQGDIDFSTFLKNISTESQIQSHLIISYWIEMLKCVKEIHSKGIIHSDLKPSNFLLVKGRLKLIDFGIASSIAADMTSVIKNEQVGTVNYISPEALLDLKDSPTKGKPRMRISYKSDVWSLGCILYQMVYRKTPFHAYGNWMMKVLTIIDKNHCIKYPPAEGVSHQLIDMIKNCLIYDMKSRPSVEELLNTYHRQLLLSI